MYRKYNNKKTVIDGIKFDSKREAARYLELKTLEHAGKISHLERQVQYILVQKEKGPEGKMLRDMKYIADFVYLDANNHRHIEDVKGVRTDVYKIKKRLMWHIHGIAIEET